MSCSWSTGTECIHRLRSRSDGKQFPTCILVLQHRISHRILVLEVPGIPSCPFWMTHCTSGDWISFEAKQTDHLHSQRKRNTCWNSTLQWGTTKIVIILAARNCVRHIARDEYCVWRWSNHRINEKTSEAFAHTNISSGTRHASK